MARRQFNNDNQVPIKVLERRFAPTDDTATFELTTYQNPFEPADVRYYVSIESTLTDEQITTLLGPMTTDEQSYLTEFNSDRRNFRSQYQSTIDQLKTIEDNAAPTNAQVVAAVRFLAQTMRLVLRLLVKTRFT